MSTITFTFASGARPVAELVAELEQFSERPVSFEEAAGSNDRIPTLRRWGDAVAWQPRSFSPGDTEPPTDVAAPQVVVTRWEDQTYSAWGWCYRRVDGEYVTVGEYHGPSHGAARTADAFLASYGTYPSVGEWSSADRPLPCAAEYRTPWLERSDTGSVPPPLHADPSPADDPARVDAIADLLTDDEYYHVAAARLAELRSEPGTATLEAAADGDPRALRTVAALGPADDDTFRRFLRGLSETDAATQRLVAPTLWEPPGVDEPADLDPALASRLASLADADAPALRTAALVGAARVLGECWRTSGDASPDRDALPEGLRDAVDDYFRSLAAALDDDHPLVRARAVGLLGEPIAQDIDHDFVFHWDDLWAAAPAGPRERIARRYAGAAERDDGAASRAASGYPEPDHYLDLLSDG